MNHPADAQLPFAPPADGPRAPEPQAAPGAPGGTTPDDPLGPLGPLGPFGPLPIGEDDARDDDPEPVAAVDAVPMPAGEGAPPPVYTYHPGSVVDLGRGLATFYGSHHYIALQLGPRPVARIVGAPRGGAPPSLSVRLFSRLGPDGRPSFQPGAEFVGSLGPVGAPQALDNCVPEAMLAAVRAAFRPHEDLRGLLLLGEAPVLVELAAHLPVVLRALLLVVSSPVVPEASRLGIRRVVAERRGLALSGQLLELLCFSPSRAFIERLRRIDYPPAWTLDSLWLLQRTLAAYPRRVAGVARLSPVSAPAIAVASQLGLARWLRPSFFDDLLRVRSHAVLASLSVRAMLEQLAEHQRRCGVDPGPLRSMDELQAKAERAALALERLDRPALPAPDGAAAGIDPPVDFPAFLRPLRSAAATALEGRAMAHCLNEADFAAVEAREAYFFAADLDDERATLMLRFEPGGMLALGELRGPKNTTVGPSLRLRIEQWIVHQNLWTVFRRQPCSLPPAQPAPSVHPALGAWGRPPDDYIPVLLGNPADGEPPSFNDPDWASAPVAPRPHPGLPPHLLVAPDGRLRACYAEDFGQDLKTDAAEQEAEARRLGWRPPAEGAPALDRWLPDDVVF
ncbi:MAG: hypothetical protein RL071_1326 [Pseudomonadota bacterium]